MNKKLTFKRPFGVVFGTALALTLSVVVFPVSIARADDLGTATLTISGDAYESYAKTGLVNTDNTDNISLGNGTTKEHLCTSNAPKAGLTIDLKIHKGTESTSGVELETTGTTVGSELNLKSSHWTENQSLKLLCSGEVAQLQFINVPGIGSFTSADGYYTEITLKVAGAENETHTALFKVALNPSSTLPTDKIIHVVQGTGTHRTFSVTSGDTVSVANQIYALASIDSGTLTVTGNEPGATVLALTSGSATTDYTVIVRAPSTTPTVDFTKVELSATGDDANFKQEIETVFERNITTGVEVDGKLHYFGDHNITRGQLAAFLYRAAGSPAVSSTDLDANFADSKGTQFENAIAWLRASGFATGVDGHFYPDAHIKRSEVAKLVANALNSKVLDETENTNNFSDIAGDDTVTNTAILTLKNLGVISGVDGKFFPHNEITRGQVAKIITKALSATVTKSVVTDTVIF
ncbi:MAG: S-layer homology domain-containing protein [Candidatus Ancillula sp.]|jgi:hypothetical protein|nr:S-layer homology domain-containing protein [Candidatus Ancillula sp.]